MDVRARSWALFSACLAALSFCGCSARRNVSPRIAQIAAAEKMSVTGIKDFGKVNDYLYRGAQPKDDSLAQLKKMGVDTVVDLRGVLHEAVNKERRKAQSLGMQFINLPGNGWSNPPDDQIAKFFALMQERPRRKIFIHCWLGGDRSGMFIAAYRIAFEGWTAGQAVEEMREFHYLEFWHPGMRRYVEEFPGRLAHSPQLASFRDLAPSSGSKQSSEVNDSARSEHQIPVLGRRASRPDKCNRDARNDNQFVIRYLPMPKPKTSTPAKRPSIVPGISGSLPLGSNWRPRRPAMVMLLLVSVRPSA